MTRCTRLFHNLIPLGCLLLMLLVDAVRFLLLCLRPSPTLAAENLFLRTQLALYQERQVKPKRALHATQMALTWLARWFDWRHALVMVPPATFPRRHRQGFRLCWHWTSRPGRPPRPADLRTLMHRMACDNPSWGEERIANELLRKLGLQGSPRTIRTYMPTSRTRRPQPDVSSHRWLTFVRHQAQAIVAGDFRVVVTATFRLLSVVVVIERATRSILHVNATAHPTAHWTLQQWRDAIPADHADRFLIRDRDSIFSQQLDQRVRHLGLSVLKAPPQSPQAHAICERLLGTRRRECLDGVIPLTEHHRRSLLQEWVWHYNQGRPHLSLGPGIPQPPPHLPAPRQAHRHRLPEHLRVVARPILGGLHRTGCEF
jgi:putative transposase